MTLLPAVAGRGALAADAVWPHSSPRGRGRRLSSAWIQWRRLWSRKGWDVLYSYAAFPISIRSRCTEKGSYSFQLQFTVLPPLLSHLLVLKPLFAIFFYFCERFVNFVPYTWGMSKLFIVTCAHTEYPFFFHSWEPQKARMTCQSINLYLGEGSTEVSLLPLNQESMRLLLVLLDGFLVRSWLRRWMSMLTRWPKVLVVWVKFMPRNVSKTERVWTERRLVGVHMCKRYK